MKLCVKLSIIALLFLPTISFIALGQSRPAVAAQKIIKFDWNCAAPASFPAKLKRAVRTTMKRNDLGRGVTWGDRAFAFDLNADQTLEYFVPISCGGTGNCTWGVYATTPVRELGLIGAETIYVYKRSDGYPNIVAYTHMSAAEGIWGTYRFQGRRYTWFGKEHKADAEGIFASKLPRHLERARPGCVTVGH